MKSISNFISKYFLKFHHACVMELVRNRGPFWSAINSKYKYNTYLKKPLLFFNIENQKSSIFCFECSKICQILNRFRLHRFWVLSISQTLPPVLKKASSKNICFEPYQKLRFLFFFLVKISKSKIISGWNIIYLIKYLFFLALFRRRTLTL